MAAAATVGPKLTSRISRRVKFTAILGVLCAGGLFGGWLWLRDSSLVAIESVEVTGLRWGKTTQIRQELISAATQMTTLHLDLATLRSAVAPFASVKGLRVQTHFPHKATIVVEQHEPVAAVLIGGQRVPVARSGEILRDVASEPGLVALHLQSSAAGARVTDPKTLATLAVVAAAPIAIRARISHVGFSNRGLVVYIHNAPELVFGDATSAAAKWAAAIRVLADSRVAGATHLDLRIAGRVAVGGLGGLVDESAPNAFSPSTTSSNSQTKAPQTAVSGSANRAGSAPQTTVGNGQP